MVLDIPSKDVDDENVSKTIANHEKLNKTSSEQIESSRKCFYFIIKKLILLPGLLVYVT